MINIEVLLQAAEFLENQLNSNDASSSSTSSVSHDSLTITNTTPIIATTNLSNNCGYSSSSSSGYSSNESNNERSSSTSSNGSQINNSNITNLVNSNSSRYLNIKPIINTKTAAQQLQSLSTNTTSVHGRRNGSSYQSSKRSAYVNKIQSKDSTTNANIHHHPYARVKTTSISSTSSLPDMDDMVTSQQQYTRMSKYQQNMSALRIEEIKRDKAIHNTLEKNRRAHLKECFECLQNELPHYRDKKVTNLAILNYTLKYIQTMNKREKENETEKMRLEKKQARLNDRLNALKAELQTDNIDYESFLTSGPLAKDEEDETSTSTASEIMAHYDADDFDNLIDDDEDEDDDMMHLSTSTSTNKCNTDDYDDTTSDTNTAYSVHNRKRTISMASKQTSKYTDESTDSISSDITVDNYNDTLPISDCKKTINIKSSFTKAYEPKSNGQYYVKSFEPISQQQKLTQVTTATQQPAIQQQQQQQQQSINLKNYLLNGTQTTPTAAQLNGLYNASVNSREILQKVLMNDKVQIKHISTEYNQQMQPHIKTTIINTSTPKIDVKQEPIVQQQQIVTSTANTPTSLVKRARSSRPATVNQLLSNNQLKPSDSSTATPVTATTTVSTPTTTQITLINKSSSGDSSHAMPTILVKHQASSSSTTTTPHHHNNNTIINTSTPTHANAAKATETIYQSFTNGYKALNAQFPNNFKSVILNPTTNNAQLTQAIQSMQILTNKQKLANNCDELK